MNHFITITGGRRFFIEEVIEPALPPFSDPSMAVLVEEGLAPDVDTLLQHLPEDATHSKLYISAKVAYLEEVGELVEDDQAYLRSLTSNIVHRAGRGMNVDATVLDGGLNPSAKSKSTSVKSQFTNIAALCLNDLEARQQLLACSTAAEALHELQTHVFGFVDEAE